jgi:type III pantothenate kinase
MIFCVDLGNTTTTFGLLDGTNIRTSWRVITRVRTADEYAIMVQSQLALSAVDTSDISIGGICSVVPSETEEVICALSSSLDICVERIEGIEECGITIQTDNPAEVGADRIANAVGLFYCHGGPGIVVDMGTATTYDYISGSGEYRGGVIAPGMAAGARDLWQRARMLPAVEISKPTKIVGTTTIGAMQAGIFHGTVAQVEGIVRRMWSEIAVECRVVFTGGRAKLIVPELGFDCILDPHLTLKGIALAVDGDLRGRAG